MNTTVYLYPVRKAESRTGRYHIFNQNLPAPAGVEDPGPDEWVPLVDIIECQKEYVIKAELPEVSKGDVKVTVESGVLTISGHRNFEKMQDGKRYHRVERPYGRFTRSFSLPKDADHEKVNAEARDGLLKIHVAKNEAAKPRQIKIASA